MSCPQCGSTSLIHFTAGRMRKEGKFRFFRISREKTGEYFF
ncbi:MAG: hypothetical protein PWQ91_618 [Eubacteriales bacterium]|nr:hypothetical protein [Eubacteriales bacterium]